MKKRKRKNGTRGSNWIRSRKRWAIYHRDGFRCVYCAKAPENEPLTLDHLVARENCGTNEPSNLVTCCVSCNTSKKDLTFRRWLKLLRERGVNTAPVHRRIRRLVKKELQMDWQQGSLPTFVERPARFDQRPETRCG